MILFFLTHSSSFSDHRFSCRIILQERGVAKFAVSRQTKEDWESEWNERWGAASDRESFIHKIHGLTKLGSPDKNVRQQTRKNNDRCRDDHWNNRQFWMGHEKSHQKANDFRSFGKFNELRIREIHVGVSSVNIYKTPSRRTNWISSPVVFMILNYKMLSEITVSALRFDTFCLLKHWWLY